MRPADGRSRPEIARSSVLLPAPLLPTSATMSPSAHREIDAAQHADMAVADFQAAHLQQGRAGAHDAACPTLACDPM